MAKPNKGKIAKPTCMEPDEFIHILAKLNLPGIKATEFLGIHERTMRRLKSGHSPIDARTAMLLRAMDKFKISPERLAKLLAK